MCLNAIASDCTLFQENSAHLDHYCGAVTSFSMIDFSVTSYKQADCSYREIFIEEKTRKMENLADKIGVLLVFLELSAG